MDKPFFTIEPATWVAVVVASAVAWAGIIGGVYAVLHYPL
jgi:hypothetical protein